MADIGDFEEFADGCGCGDPLGHHRDCIVGRPFNGRPTALFVAVNRSCRESIPKGPLGRQGWLSRGS